MVGHPLSQFASAPTAPGQPSAPIPPTVAGSAGLLAGAAPLQLEDSSAGRAGSGPEGRSGASSSLEEATHTAGVLSLFDRDLGLREGRAPCSSQWSVKLVEYQDGFRVSCYRRRGEGGASRYGAPDADSSLSPSSAPSPAAGGSRSESSIRRSRALVMHRMRCLSPRSLWTFTRRGKFGSLDELWRAWTLFRKSFRRRVGDEWRFVAVPELHSDGETWHLHVAFDRWCDVVTLRRLWYRALGGSGSERGCDTPGNVDVKSFGRGSSSPKRLARYVSKYVGKGFERSSANRRIFAASVGLHPVRVERWYHAFDDGVGTLASTVSRWLYTRFAVPQGNAWFFFGAVEGFIFSTG